MVGIGTPYTVSGVHPPVLLWICVFYRDPSLDKCVRIYNYGILTERICYVVYYTRCSIECVRDNVCGCWATTLRTCVVWCVFSVHCKTIHRLTNAPFGGQPFPFSPSRKQQAPSRGKPQATSGGPGVITEEPPRPPIM